MKTCCLLFAVAGICFFAGEGFADPGAGWPRTFTANGASFSVYQPQVTDWTGNQLTARLAVSVTPQGAAAPQFGTMVLMGTTDVDNEQQVVSLSNLTPAQINFPSAPDQATNYAGLVTAQASTWAQNLSLPAIRANLAVTTAEGQPTVAVQNPVPTIFTSDGPAVLVLVNGEPALRAVNGVTLLRVINTQALILMDPTSGLYFLRINGGWVQASALNGPWTAAQTPPASLATVLAGVSDTAQLYDPPKGSEPGPLPTVFVSTAAAELVTTEGPAQLAPIDPTQLLQVTNSTGSIFVYVPTQAWYVVLSGRWFTGPSLAGPWQFVASNALPADFAMIPESHPAGTVLASVAGTPQANEAAISSTIPQTATISRTASTTVDFVGTPEFQPIAGTALGYAINTSTPVIKVAEDSYYAIVKGVWFQSAAPTGPWAVADSVPPEIYAIPPSCPIYYVTNVSVYGSTPEVVYTGYTPGYFGPCLAPEGVVVFGTGYWYPPFIGGDVWIGPPVTYGFGAGFACGLSTGFAFGLVADHAWGCSPWWGPWHGGWEKNWNNVNINTRNVYNNWSNNVVKNTHITRTDVNNAANNIRSNPNYQNWKNDRPQANDPARAENRQTVDRQTLQNDASRLGNNDVFAGKDGQAYRAASDGGWQQQKGDGWAQPDRNAFNDSMRSDLDSQRFSRNVGQQRSFGGGGGFRGGGGRR